VTDRPPPQEIEPAEARAQAGGRRAALITYFGVAAVVSAIGGGQVIWQTFRPAPPGGTDFASCGDGLVRLAAAIDRARSAASLEGGEDAALIAFRGALAPEWDSIERARVLCGEAGAADVATLERLRYAEEHAIRREASDLAPLRRRAQEALGRFGR